MTTKLSADGARHQTSAAATWAPLARFIQHERRLANRVSRSGPVGHFAYEFVRFGVKQGWACLFGGLMLSALIATHLWYPKGAVLARYDFLVLMAVAIQVAMLAFRLETQEEAKVILIFHIVGTAMEIFKVSAGSWAYPEPGILKLGGVPLFTGFMYAAVGSFIARVWRLFDFRFTHHPPLWSVGVLAMAVYGNFFSHHFLPDLRIGLFALAALLFGRTWVHYRIWRHHRSMPLLLGLMLVALFIWFAENIGTLTQAWVYPNQKHGWAAVPLSKLGAWFLLMLISYALVAFVQGVREMAPRHVRLQGTSGSKTGWVMVKYRRAALRGFQRLLSAGAGMVTMTIQTPARADMTRAPQPAIPSAYQVEIVARRLEYPWGLQFLPDGRMLVTERPGRLRVVGRDGTVSAPVEGVPAVVARDQGGLLDVALANDFATSGTIYLTFSEPREKLLNGTSLYKARLVMAGGGGRLEDGRVIFRQLPSIPGGHHFGSRIVITRDGSLFVSLGERYSQREQAQNPANHMGKVVRLTADGAPHPGNPNLPGWDPAVWSIGHRNIQGATLDPSSGQLWTTEHGAMGGDELNHPEPGKNYGWPVITYGRDYSGAKIGIGTVKDGLEQPVYYWDPSIATSGLAMYTGDLFPAWKGNLFAGGLAGMQIARLVMKDGRVVAEEALLTDRGWRIRDVRMGPDGALWALTDEPNGFVVRIVPKN